MYSKNNIFIYLDKVLFKDFLSYVFNCEILTLNQGCAKAS